MSPREMSYLETTFIQHPAPPVNKLSHEQEREGHTDPSSVLLSAAIPPQRRGGGGLV